ncbi:protein IMPAIRED IN BABA-INDUCED STERILITY 1-like isoform X2 [Zingiber officinale]|uniref:protein IMPAIRED IN BABA-INDUCED STERILITY 1-like isoform X2 n=1 Tax=Zingiber officinale TaxID=94328 RepID=UPI001C4DD268|nr:protein IMPAIRED IN BABA-INDUCED STERILITY 1-like isoform X2 [Zingiber officinale]
MLCLHSFLFILFRQRGFENRGRESHAANRIHTTTKGTFLGHKKPRDLTEARRGRVDAQCTLYAAFPSSSLVPGSISGGVSWSSTTRSYRSPHPPLISLERGNPKDSSQKDRAAMGCAVSKNAVSATPVADSSGIVRSNQKRLGLISAPSGLHRTGEGTKNGHPEREEENGRLESGGKGKVNDDNTSLQSLRLRNLHKYIEGEQVAAGWPSWLSAVAGEAIQGWVPLKADSFEKLEKIGQGTYSSVFRARDLDTGKMVALKKVRFDNFEPESVRFMAREIKILRTLDHPNIIKLEGLIASRLSCSLYLVFEYMEHDLAGLASSPDIVLSESQVKCYTYQLLSALEHCHSQGVIHRDIKGANLLVNNDGILKMADFGLANFCRPGHKYPLTSRVVTLWYRPPELLLGSTNYEATVDLWSVGCVFAEMFVGRPILQGRTEVEQLHKIFRLCGSPPEEFWKKSKLPHATIFKPHRPYVNSLYGTFQDLPRAAISLLETFLSVEPYKRGSATSALASEYFRTMPYACEPSSLPKYSPTKEMDIKNREASQRRRIAGRQEAMRRPFKADRTSGQSGGLSKLADTKKDAQLNVEATEHDEQKGLKRVDGETRLFVDLQPMPSIKNPDEGHHMKHNSEQDIVFSGPLRVSTSSGFSWARRQREDHVYNRSHSRRNSRRNLSAARDLSDIENVKSKLGPKGPQNGDLHAGSKHHESQELAKIAMLKRWAQLEHPGSFDTSESFPSQDFSEALCNGDPSSMRHNYMGFNNQDRVEFSGPLLSQTCKVDELLQKHERQIRQAVRRSWFRRVAGRRPRK